jgi:glutaredoxin 3
MEGLMPNSNTPPVRIYTKKWCGFCFMAKRLFNGLEIEFEEIRVDRDPELRWRISAEAGNWPTVPMIFVGDHFVGGYTEAAKLHRKGGLLPLCHPE